MLTSTILQASCLTSGTAFSRILVKRYGIPESILGDHFSCAPSTIHKAVEDSYATPDDVAKDFDMLVADPKFNQLWSK
jgi:hypothetical protein